MMDFDTIVEALGKAIEETLVFHRSMEQHHQFKVIKIFKYSLYSINKETKEKKLLLSDFYQCNSSTDDIEEAQKVFDKAFLEYIFYWLYRKKFPYYNPYDPKV